MCYSSPVVVYIDTCRFVRLLVLGKSVVRLRGEALCTASKIHNCVATQNLELCSMLASGVALSIFPSNPLP